MAAPDPRRTGDGPIGAAEIIERPVANDAGTAHCPSCWVTHRRTWRWAAPERVG